MRRELLQAVAVRTGPGRQVQHLQYLVIVDPENLVFLRRPVLHHPVAQHVQHPADGRLFVALLVDERLVTFAEDHEFIAGLRVQRLDAPLPLDGQHGEVVQVKAARRVGRRLHDPEETDRGHASDAEGQVTSEAVHDTALLRRKPTRLMPKWINMPITTIAQAR